MGIPERSHELGRLLQAATAGRTVAQVRLHPFAAVLGSAQDELIQFVIGNVHDGGCSPPSEWPPGEKISPYFRLFWG